MTLPLRTQSSGMHLNKEISLATTAPSGTTSIVAAGEAHGRVGDDGKISFALDAAKTVTVYLFFSVAKKWIKRDGTVSAAQDTLHVIDAPPKTLFKLVIDATTATGWIYSESSV